MQFSLVIIGARASRPLFSNRKCAPRGARSNLQRAEAWRRERGRPRPQCLRAAL